MVIIYLHQYFALPSSSGGTRSYDLAKRFTLAGHRVIVVTTSAFLNSDISANKKNWSIINQEGIELHILKLNYSNNMSFMMRILVFIKFFLYASIRLIKIKADVVLATSTPLTIAIPAILKETFSKTPFIFEVRDVWPEGPIAMGIIKNPIIISLSKWFEKFIYSKAALIVALSPDMKASVEKRIKSPEKVTVIPNIAVIERFSHFDINYKLLARHIGFTPAKVVLYAGTLGMVNGLKYLVDMAYHSLIRDPEIIFVIFGNGMEKEDLKKYAEIKKVINKNLFFFDPVPKSALPQLYFECTIAASFVIPVPELWANSANKFFDSLAAGRPILINHRGWQAEIIEKENIGFVMDFKIENLQKEVSRFCSYINNPALIAKQGSNAKQVAENFSLNAATAKYLEILNKI